MQRHAFAMKVKDGQMAEFRTNLGKVWGELTALLDAKKMKNFSIWNVERMIFGYYETDDDFAFSAEDKEKANNWMAAYGSSFEWISTPFEEMRLMYHDFGIVRECKELIRHRVFMTKLVPGSEEEYKARHDKLVEARGDVVTPGPDSNFSIWNAGGYIFGYNEIDTTMETERTQADIEADTVWETKMLEIMSWLTDDVDWLTGLHHENVKRLAWHN
ncbi:MAG: L-rhamnose mutarotase [Lachnospiraceae bacterium]|nr:L-rhamnose mutarotase [Lachnospiraceae bacterium]